MPNLDDQLRFNNLSAELTDILSNNSNILDKMSNSTSNLVSGTQRLIQKEQDGEKISKRQLGWLQGSVSQIQKANQHLSRTVSFQQQANSIINDNRNLFKNLSDEQKRSYKTSIAASKNLSVSEQERAISAKKAVQLLQEQLVVQQKQTEILEEYTGWLDEARQSWQKIRAQVNGLAKNPMVLMTAIAGLVLNKLMDWGQAILDVKKELGLSVKETLNATAAIGEAQLTAAQYGSTVKETAEAYTAMVNETGNLEFGTARATANIAKFAKIAGLSADESAKVYTTFSEMPDVTESFAGDMMETAKSMSRAAGVPLGRIMKDIGNNTEIFAIAGKDGAKNLIQATVMASKLGISMSTLAKTAEGLLDIESSLGSEMEASVLLGRDINLNKAREYAMSNDLVGVANEVVKAAGGKAEWNKMDIIQKRALADAMKMELKDVEQIVANQDQLKGLTLEQLQAKIKSGDLDSDTLEKGAGMASLLTKENAMLILATGQLILQTAQMGFQFGLLKKMGSLGGKAGGWIKGLLGGGASAATKTATPEVPKSGGSVAGKAGGGMMESISKIKPAQMLAAGAAMIMIAAAVWILAKAMQEMANVGGAEFAMTIGLIAAMGITIGVLGVVLGPISPLLWAVGAAFLLLGAGVYLAAAGVKLLAEAFVMVLGAISGFATEMVKLDPVQLLAVAGGLMAVGVAAMTLIPGALGVALFGAALLPLGFALTAFASGFSILPSLATSMTELVSQTEGIYALSGAFGTLALSIAGLAGSLLLLAPMLPVLAAAKFMGVDVSNEGSKEEKSSTGNEAILAKLDELIAAVRSGAIIEMDGAKVGQAVVKYVNKDNGSAAAGRSSFR